MRIVFCLLKYIWFRQAYYGGSIDYFYLSQLVFVTVMYVLRFLFCFHFKSFNMLEFQEHIWKQHEKCIQISTDMPGIGYF